MFNGAMPAIPNFTINFELAALNRYLRRGTIEKGVQISKYCLLAICVILVGIAIWEIINNITAGNKSVEVMASKIAAVTELPGGSPKSEKGRPDTQALVQKKIFGEVGMKGGAQNAQAPVKAPPKTELALIGTFVGATLAEYYAIIEDTKKKNQDVFSLDEIVFDDAKLVSITADSVTVDRNGEKQTLTIDDSAPTGGSGAGSGSGAVDEFTIDASELDQALENLPLLLTQARAVPYFKDGKSIGLRLFAIKAGSLFEKIGLKNGDILKTINGNSLADITQAVKQFEELKKERSISVLVERNREEREFRYQVR